MFDSNAMADRAALARSRDGGAGPGVHKVWKTAKAFHDAQMREMSPWRRAVYEATFRWKQASELAREHYRLDCLVDVDGTYLGDGIPF